MRSVMLMVNETGSAAERENADSRGIGGGQFPTVGGVPG